MKNLNQSKLFAVVVMLFIAVNASFAQEDEQVSPKDGEDTDYVVIDHQKRKSDINTLLGDDIQHGGYLGIVLNMEEIDDVATINLGGRLGWIWNHSFAIGLVGKGFFNLDNQSIVGSDSVLTTSLYGGYGGLFFEPIILPKTPVHVSFPIAVGVGGAGFTSEKYHRNDEDFEWNVNESDGFLVFEPGVEVEFNVVRFFRLALNASYRYTYDFELTTLDNNALNGFNFGTTFKFGFF